MNQLFHLVPDAADPDDDISPEGADHRLIQNLARAAEYLVAADILERNWCCSIASEGLRYDLIAEIGIPRRVQVKMCQRAVFQNSERGNLFYKYGRAHRGKRDYRSSRGVGLSEYRNEIDVFAFVAFDKRRILYMLPEQIETSSLKIRSSEFTDEKSNLSWEAVLREWGIG